MGNKSEKGTISANNENKMNKIISDYLISGKEGDQKLKNLIISYNKDINKKQPYQHSKVSEFLENKKLVDFSLLIAEQIKLKALNKDLELNLGKVFVVNSNTFQDSNSDNEKENENIYDNKCGYLQMNSYDNRFNTHYQDFYYQKLLKKEYLNKNIDELEFEKKIEEEIKKLKENEENPHGNICESNKKLKINHTISLNSLNELISKDNDNIDKNSIITVGNNLNNNIKDKSFFFDDVSLQEYLNIETQRLKKDRSKLNESSKKNLNIENELIVYDNLKEKNLDLKQKNKHKFEKRDKNNEKSILSKITILKYF